MNERRIALVGLGDEYSSLDACFDAPTRTSTFEGGLLKRANLTLDATGARWAHVVDGAEEGGDGYASCIYHPTDRCRMLESSETRYCPVCDREVQRFIDGKRGLLAYRGHAIESLSEHSTFQEVAWLLLYGSLPTAAELAEQARAIDARTRRRSR